MATEAQPRTKTLGKGSISFKSLVADYHQFSVRVNIFIYLLVNILVDKCSTISV